MFKQNIFDSTSEKIKDVILEQADTIKLTTGLVPYLICSTKTYIELTGQPIGVRFSPVYYEEKIKVLFDNDLPYGIISVR